MVFNLLGSNLLYVGFAGSYLATASFDFNSLRWLSVDGFSKASGVIIFLAFITKAFSVPTSLLAQSVYSRLPAELAQFFASLTKLSYFIFLFKIWYIEALITSAHVIPVCLTVFSVLIVGAFGALRSFSLNSVLFYSSLQHAAAIAIVLISGLSQSVLWAAFFYLMFYIINVILIFVVASHAFAPVWFLEKSIGGSKLFFCLLVFSLAGLPPFVGFFAKLSVLAVAADNGFILLTYALGFSSIVATLYYGR